jgi:hypothetical protein
VNERYLKRRKTAKKQFTGFHRELLYIIKKRSKEVSEWQ